MLSLRNSRRGRRLIVSVVGLTACAALAQPRVDAVDSVIDAEMQAAQISILAQAQIDELAGETTDLLGEYRLALQQLDRVRLYNQNLAAVVADQERARSAMGQKIANYQATKQDLVPLMMQMIDTLDRFVELDLPFHLDERRARVARLRDNLDDSQLSNSERFRQIMEAYQIEMAFGRDTDAYTGWLEANGPRREVNFLRIGRLVLAYQSHDRLETGFYDPVTRSWQTLGDEYRGAVADGLRIARKQAAPNLLRLPVPAPVTAQ